MTIVAKPILLAAFAFCAVWGAISAQLATAANIDPNAVELHAADRAELLKIMAECEQAINDQKLDLFTRHVDDAARVTFLNGEVAIGPSGVKDYFNRMVGPHDGATLSKYVTHAKVTDHARFYGELENAVAVANGTMEDEFTPHARGVFKFSSKWSAAFARKNNEWKIISLHFSTNTFNNVLTDELRYKIWEAGFGGFLAGLFLAAAFIFWRKKRQL